MTNPCSSIERRDDEPVFVESLTKEEQLFALEPEWTALEHAAGNTLPFRTAAWTLAWWQHLRQHRAAVRDSLAIRTIRTEGGRLIGVAPLLCTERPGVGLIRTRRLAFIGADPNVTELRGPLFHPDHQVACVTALATDLRRCSSEWDWMVWSGIPSGGPAEAALSEVVTWQRSVPYYTLTLEPDWEQFRGKLGRNIKESLRKCYNSLKRDGFLLSFEVVTDQNKLDAALADFFRLHAARACLRDTVVHADLFGQESFRRFLRDVCGRFAALGALRVYRLFVSGRLAASRIGFVLGGSVYFYYSGYDPEFRQYSVMTTTTVEAIKSAFAEGIGSVNLSTGNDVSKTRWSPVEHVEREGVTTASHRRARLTRHAYSLVERAFKSPQVSHLRERFAAHRPSR